MAAPLLHKTPMNDKSDVDVEDNEDTAAKIRPDTGIKCHHDLTEDEEPGHIRVEGEGAQRVVAEAGTRDLHTALVIDPIDLGPGIAACIPDRDQSIRDRGRSWRRQSQAGAII